MRQHLTKQRQSAI